MRKISQGSGISITLENKTIEKRANWSSQLIQSYFFLRNSTYEKRTNEKWNSFRSIKRKNPIEDEVELIDSCSRSGREIRNKRSAETGLWEIYSPRPVEVNAGTNGRRDRERRESAVKRSMVSLRFTLRETLATVIRLYSYVSIHTQGEGEKLARRSSPPTPLLLVPPLPCLSRVHPVPFGYSSNIQRNGDRFCVEFAESMETPPTCGRMVYPRADRGSYE